MQSVKSTFKGSDQGWTVQGDVKSAEWDDHGGNPGGFFHWVDKAIGEDAYYVAPDAYRGDKHAFYGGTLSYDIEDTGSTYSGVPDVELVGANGTTLVAAVGQPGTDWTHLSIALQAGAGWHVGSLGGADATRADFKGVLADVSQLLIRAEYIEGAERGGLDNVFLARSTPAAVQPHFEALIAHVDGHGGGEGLHWGHLAIA